MARRKAARGSRRLRAVGLGALIAGGAALIGIFAARREWMIADAEHEASDLALDAPRPGTDRAPEAFRPDPTAQVPASERESLRPPGPQPSHDVSDPIPA